MFAQKRIFIIILLMGALFGVACSTARNSPSTRAYHSLTTRYNLLYNARKAYDELMEDQLTIFPGEEFYLLRFNNLPQTGEKTSTGGAFDIVIEKTAKAIREHSITSKPRRDPAKAKSKEYLEWLRQEEFNPALKDAWLLMGKAHFRNGDYEEALTLFSEILRIYKQDNELALEVQVWMMNCYSGLNRMYDASNMAYILRSTNLPPRIEKIFAESYMHYLVQDGQYKEAIPILVKTIGFERNSLKKKRFHYLRGQLLILAGEEESAFNAFEEVKGLSTPRWLSQHASAYQSNLLSGKQQLVQVNELREVPGEYKKLFAVKAVSLGPDSAAVPGVVKYERLEEPLPRKQFVTTESGLDDKHPAELQPTKRFVTTENGLVNKHPEQPKPSSGESRLAPSELKQELEKKASEAIARSEAGSPGKSRENLLKEREQQRKERILQREQELKVRIQEREQELRAREKKREREIREQQKVREKKRKEQQRALNERENIPEQR